MKTMAVIVIVLFSCSMPLVVPKMTPQTGNICVEAFRLYSGKIYVVRSEVIPGQFYFEGATRSPKRVRVWMEIYVADGRKIILYKIINAERIPATPEGWEFEKE